MESNPRIMPYSEWIQNNPELLEAEEMCSQCGGSGVEDCDCDCNENCSLCWGNGEHKCFVCGGTGTDNTARWAYNEQVKKDRDLWFDFMPNKSLQATLPAATIFRSFELSAGGQRA